MFLTFTRGLQVIYTDAQIDICNRWYRFTRNSLAPYIIYITPPDIDTCGSYRKTKRTLNAQNNLNERYPVVLYSTI